MITLVLTACPPGLRGDLTKWLFEIAPGVYVGDPPSRVVDALWLRVVETCSTGRAILVRSAENEQGFTFVVHNHDWMPLDFDGLLLMHRPAVRATPARRTGWSRARVQRRALRPKWGGRDDGPADINGTWRED